MDILRSTSIFITGALSATPLAVAIWWRISNYDGDMGYPIVLILQIPKILFFAGIPYLAACILFRKLDYKWQINFLRASFYSGIFWTFIWFFIFEFFGPVSKSLPPDYRFAFVILMIFILPVVLIFGLILVFEITFKRIIKLNL